MCNSTRICQVILSHDLPMPDKPPFERPPMMGLEPAPASAIPAACWREAEIPGTGAAGLASESKWVEFLTGLRSTGARQKTPRRLRRGVFNLQIQHWAFQDSRVLRQAVGRGKKEQLEPSSNLHSRRRPAFRARPDRPSVPPGKPLSFLSGNSRLRAGRGS